LGGTAEAVPSLIRIFETGSRNTWCAIRENKEQQKLLQQLLANSTKTRNMALRASLLCLKARIR